MDFRLCFNATPAVDLHFSVTLFMPQLDMYIETVELIYIAEEGEDALLTYRLIDLSTNRLIDQLTN